MTSQKKNPLHVQTVHQEAHFEFFHFILQIKADQALTDKNSKFK